MAVKQTPPDYEKKIEKQFRTQGMAEEWAKSEKERYREAGYSVRFDIKYDSITGEWNAIFYYWS
jgi:hypothetical protein